MKKPLITIFTILVIAVAAFAFTGCNNTSTDKLLYRNWSETQTEIFTYDITHGGQSVGAVTHTIAPIEGGYRVSINQVMTNGDTISGYVDFSNKGSVFAFPPIESVRTSSIGGVVQTQKIVYSGENLSYYYSEGDSIPEDATPQGHKISTPYFDNFQFYTILRGATFDRKFNLSFKVFVAAENDVVGIQCSLGTTTKISYNLGEDAHSIDCQPVSLVRDQQITGSPSVAYYATGNITVGESTVKQALVRFIEDEYTYTLKNIEVV